jgi:DNA-binding response OmpR family regulator
VKIERGEYGLSPKTGPWSAGLALGRARLGNRALDSNSTFVMKPSTLSSLFDHLRNTAYAFSRGQPMYVLDDHSILVVEDMQNLRDYIADILSDLGDHVQIDTAADGVEALEKIKVKGEPYDLILSDITMPRMDGESLIEELDAMHYQTAIIMLTAHGQDDHIVRCMKAGACDYLIKPVDMDELLAAVTNALQHAPMQRVDMDVDFDREGWFEITASSDYSVLYRYRRFLSLLDAFQLADQDAEEIRLCLEELGRNAIEWGNRNDVSKRVRFGCRILPSKLIIQIADEGTGFIPEEIPDPTVDPLQHLENRKDQGKRMGGYGVHLVRNMMDKLVYNEKGNVVVAIKYINRGDSGQSGVHRAVDGSDSTTF